MEQSLFVIFFLPPSMWFTQKNTELNVVFGVYLWGKTKIKNLNYG